ncbi:unnamed protein product [Sphagnum jensenii]
MEKAKLLSVWRASCIWNDGLVLGIGSPRETLLTVSRPKLDRSGPDTSDVLPRHASHHRGAEKSVWYIRHSTCHIEARLLGECLPLPAAGSSALGQVFFPSATACRANAIREQHSTEMTHRQSGGYKEEPGVAVAGDHPATRVRWPVARRPRSSLDHGGWSLGASFPATDSKNQRFELCDRGRWRSVRRVSSRARAWGLGGPVAAQWYAEAGEAATPHGPPLCVADSGHWAPSAHRPDWWPSAIIHRSRGRCKSVACFVPTACATRRSDGRHATR